MSRGDGLWQDGGRLQSWLKRHLEIRGRSRTSGWRTPQLGLVIARYYLDDQEHTRDGVVTEYDVYIPRYQITLERITQMVPYQGVVGGQQVTLTVASGRPDSTNPTTHWQNVMDSDGDLVIVQYVGGKLPLIMGCVNHIRDSASAVWHTDSVDGDVLSTTYNTTRTRFNNDGNIEIDFDDSGGSHDRNLIINVDGEQFLKVAQDAGTGDVRVELGGKAGKALEKAILGERHKTWMNENTPVTGPIGLVEHVHQYTKPDGAGGPGLLADTGKPALAGSLGLINVPPMPDSHLTDKIKLEEE